MSIKEQRCEVEVSGPSFVVDNIYNLGINASETVKFNE